MAVQSIMYGMDVIAWSESEIEKLEVGQNRIVRIAINAPRYAAVEALRGDMGCSTFRERHMKATLRYKVRLERMEDTRLARKVYLWNVMNSKWGKKCMKMIDRSSMLVRWIHPPLGERQYVYEWRLMNRSREGLEWEGRKWKSEIDGEVRHVGLRNWKYKMEQKKTLEWYREKEAPMR